MPLKSKFISSYEAAQLMHVKPQTLHVVLKAGRLLGAQKVAGRWIIPLPIRLIPGRRGPRSNWVKQGGILAKNAMDVHYASNSFDWNSPRDIVERVIRVLRQIDLDPCSNCSEQPNVPALKHFTIIEDGLRHAWYGVVYMNPPYGNQIIQWVTKLCEEFNQGRTTEAVALLPARTDTRWFSSLASFPKCFIHGRLKFGNGPHSAPFPSVAVYMGGNEQQFSEVFGDIGTVYVRTS